MAEERWIEFLFGRGGVVRAKLLCDEAPQTCEAVWNALPLEVVAKQARTAGEEIYAETPIRGLKEENVTQAKAGDVHFCTHDPYYSITMYYGNMVKVAPFNWFARIKDEDMTRFQEIAHRIWMLGFERMIVSKFEG